jgi:predicted CopG family antitoxin
MSKLTTIAVSEKNYLTLKSLGRAGDSFNDVLTEVLRKINSTKITVETNGEYYDSTPIMAKRSSKGGFSK